MVLPASCLQTGTVHESDMKEVDLGFFFVFFIFYQKRHKKVTTA